jgi:predicted ATP-dependent serine protease
MEQGVKIASWHLEERQLRSLLGIVSYRLGANVTRKDLVEEGGLEEVVKAELKELAESELYVQFSMDENCTSDDVINQIKFLREAYGVQFVIMEPVQDILNLKPAEREATLAQFAIRLSKVAAQTGVGIILVAHTNKEGDAKYCDMLSQRASVVIDLKRDKKAKDDTEKNTTHIWVEKNRPTSLEGKGGQVYFDLDTFTINTEWFQ